LARASLTSENSRQSLLLELRAGDDLLEVLQGVLDRVAVVRDEERRDRCSADHPQFERCGMDDGLHAAAVEDEDPEHADREQNETDDREHGGSLQPDKGCRSVRAALIHRNWFTSR